MNKQTLGKKIYSSRMLWPIRVLILILFFILLISFINQTLEDPRFINWENKSILGFFSFHYFYPEEMIVFILTILFPSFYYGLIRSVRFFENGIIINRGLPFFNRIIYYAKIKRYKIVHPKYLLTIEREDLEDEMLISISNMERVVAILDNHDISGILRGREFLNILETYKKVIFAISFIAAILFIIQYFGITRMIFRE